MQVQIFRGSLGGGRREGYASFSKISKITWAI
jgi:hypothetical protein